MDRNTDVSEADFYSLRHNAVWDGLYHFLEVRVRYWVYSDHLSLWHGREEDITAEIVQGSVVNTLVYTTQYSHSLWAKKKGAVLCRSLQRISGIIAYKQYQEERHYAVCTASGGFRCPLAQEYFAIDECIDLLERVVQEWCCERLVGIIAGIPVRLRNVLLVHLANRMCLSTQLTSLLQSTFLKRDICLQDYRQPPFQNVRKRREYEALLQLACGQIVRKQKQENNELLARREETTELDDSQVNKAERDLEYTVLMANLEATAPSPCPDLAFREELRDQLLDIQIEQQISQAVAARSNQASEASVLLSGAGETIDGEDSEPPDGSDPFSDESDTELSILAAYLDPKAPLELVDPVFREILREKLKSIWTARSDSALAEDMLEATERVLDQLPEEWHPADLNSIDRIESIFHGL